MTKTKDEIIAEIGNGEHVINYSTPIMPSDVRRAYSLGVELGASKMYDHRQQEIDELQDTLEREREGHDLHLDEVNRWWAERWQRYRYLDENFMSNFNTAPEQEAIMGDLNAAAARVMEVKG